MGDGAHHGKDLGFLVGCGNLSISYKRPVVAKDQGLGDQGPGLRFFMCMSRHCSESHQGDLDMLILESCHGPKRQHCRNLPVDIAPHPHPLTADLEASQSSGDIQESRTSRRHVFPPAVLLRKALAHVIQHYFSISA